MALDPFQVPINQTSDLVLEKDQKIIASIPRDDIDLNVVNGDLAVVTGPSAIKEALIRSLRTPLGSYGITFVGYDSSGTRITFLRDTEYGSTLHDLVSQPMTNTWIKSLVDTVVGVISKDSRVSVTDIDLKILNPAGGQIYLSVSYELLGTGIEENLQFETTVSNDFSIT